MSDNRVKLKILGISYSPVKSGAFALLLAQDDGPYRIPIVIGAAEAQSIALKIEGVVPPRPITHDLFTSLAHAFGIELVEVFIYKFEDGIFSSALTFSDGVREVKLDSRTSDAIAIAIRTGAPIYTTREIMMQTGTILDEEATKMENEKMKRPEHRKPAPKTYDTMSTAELQASLDKMISDENYEEAAKISEIIRRRSQQ